MPLPLRRRALVAAAAAAGLVAVTATMLTPAPTPHGGAIAAPHSAQRLITADLDGAAGAARAGTGAAVAARTGTKGYVLATPELIGITPKGLTVYVDRGAQHHDSIAGHAKAAVKLWRSYGLHATYAGWGTPKLGEGIVTIAEGPAGCDGATNRVGNTWQSWLTLPNDQRYVYSGRIVMCPSLWHYAKWQWSATIRHELGHAAGLGHFDGTYEGSTQVMRSVNNPPVASYKSGDVNGLKFLAAHNTYVKEAVPARGKLEQATTEGSNIRLTGWALLDYYLAKKVTIVVTDNGKPFRKVTTDVVRDDINKLYDSGTSHPHGFTLTFPWPGGNHEYCLSAVSPVKASTTVDLGCSIWSS